MTHPYKILIPIHCQGNVTSLSTLTVYPDGDSKYQRKHQEHILAESIDCGNCQTLFVSRSGRKYIYTNVIIQFIWLLTNVIIQLFPYWICQDWDKLLSFLFCIFHDDDILSLSSFQIHQFNYCFLWKYNYVK